MDQKVKKALSVLFIVLSITAVVCIAFGNQELTDAWDAVRRLDFWYILCLLGCITRNDDIVHVERCADESATIHSLG